MSDGNVLTMISRFPNLDHLSMARWGNFSRLEGLPRACFPSAGTLLKLNLSKVETLQDHHLEVLVDVLESLTHLYLGDTFVTDLGLEYLHRLKNLCVLHLDGCKMITSGGVERVLSYAPELREVSLKKTMVTDDMFHGSSVCARSRRGGKPLKLTKLDLGHCKRLTRLSIGPQFFHLQTLSLASNLGLAHLGLSTPSLRVLNLSQCKQLVSVRFHTSMLSLEALNFSNASKLQSITFEGSSPHTSLQAMNLCQCRSLEPKSFLALTLSSSGTLTTLNIDGMIQLSDQIMMEFLPKVPRLVHLDNRGCRNLSTPVKRMIEQILHRRQDIEEQKEKQTHHSRSGGFG
jgi:hypothetical protein